MTFLNAMHIIFVVEYCTINLSQIVSSKITSHLLLQCANVICLKKFPVTSDILCSCWYSVLDFG